MYNVLSPSLKVLGSLTLDNGPGSTAFWSDSINQQIADDGATTDPNSLIQMTQNAVDLNANHKLWNHTVSVSFDNSTLGKQVESGYYLTYVSPNNGRTYLITLYSVKEDTAGATKIRTAQGSNSAIYELGKIYPAAKNFTQASLKDIVTYLSSYIGWSLVVPDDTSYQIPYVIDGKTSAMAIVQDLLVKFDVEADAYINLNRSGQIYKRIIEFGRLGENTGELIRYGSPAKGFESISQEFVSDTLFTKLHVKGTNDSDISSVNQGVDFIVDDNANKLYNPVGASFANPTYLEGTITNTILSDPKALLNWAQSQMNVLNHPRVNYVVTAMHDMSVGLGDTIAVQDMTASPAILVTSRVIQSTSSFASPETNTIVLGEFSASVYSSNLVNDKLNDLSTDVSESLDMGKDALSKIDDLNDLTKRITDEVEANLKEAKEYSDKLTEQATQEIDNTLTTVDGVKLDLADVKADANGNKAIVAQLSKDNTTVKTLLSDANGNYYGDLSTAINHTTAIADKASISYVNQTATNITTSIANKADQSQIQQLSNQISLRVREGDVVNQINLDTSGVLIKGSKIVLDGSVSVTQDFWSASVNTIKVNAANILAGAIDTSKVNIISGTGAGNLQLNLTNSGIQITGWNSGDNTYVDNRLDTKGISLTYPGTGIGGSSSFQRAGGLAPKSYDGSMFNTSIALYADLTGGGKNVALGWKPSWAGQTATATDMNSNNAIHESLVVSSSGTGMSNGQGIYMLDPTNVNANLYVSGVTQLAGLTSTGGQTFKGGANIYAAPGVNGYTSDNASFRSVWDPSISGYRLGIVSAIWNTGIAFLPDGIHRVKNNTVGTLI